MAHVSRTNWIRDDLLRLHDATVDALRIAPGDAMSDEDLERAIPHVDAAVKRYFAHSRLINIINSRRAKRTFERNLARRYRAALSGTYQINTLVSGAGELGSALFARKYGRALDWKGDTPESLESDEYRDWTLIQLHARACLIFVEIVSLIESGFASGAMARRRTLFELLVVMKFIYSHGDRAAAAYWDHEAIGAYKSATEFNKHYEAFPELRFSDDEMDHLRIAAETAINAHFTDFGKDWGWAASVLGKNGMTFQRLVELTGYGNRQVYQRLSHNYIHAGASGTLNNLGSPEFYEGDRPQLLAGASNAGLIVPATISCQEIGTCTAIVLEATKSLVGAAVARHLHDSIEATNNLWGEAAYQLATEEKAEFERFRADDTAK